LNKDWFNAAGVVLEDYYRLERLELEESGILRLEVVSTDPVTYPVTHFLMPDEGKYVIDSYVIEVHVKDGAFQTFNTCSLLMCYFQFFSR